MTLDTTMVSIHAHFKIKDGKMYECISILEEILVLTKSHEPNCLFFNITIKICGSDKAYVREAYKDGSSAIFHLQNMGYLYLNFLKWLRLKFRFMDHLRELNL